MRASQRGPAEYLAIVFDMYEILTLVRGHPITELNPRTYIFDVLTKTSGSEKFFLLSLPPSPYFEPVGEPIKWKCFCLTGITLVLFLMPG